MHKLHNMHITALSCTHTFPCGSDKRQFGQECLASVRCTNSVRRRRRSRHRRVAHLTDSSISVFARLWQNGHALRACGVFCLLRRFCPFCVFGFCRNGARHTNPPTTNKKKRLMHFSSTPLTRTERARPARSTKLILHNSGASSL